MNKKPKILIISNEGINRTSSNGRTLLNFLGAFSKNNICQFYIKGYADKELVGDSLKISDEDIISFIFHKKKTRIVENNFVEKRPKTRNCFKLLLRNSIWNACKKKNHLIKDFVLKNRPDLILFDAGDAPFMYNIVNFVINFTNVKLIIFNTENYVLKTKLYSKAIKFSPFHLLLRTKLRRSFIKCYKKSSVQIFNSEFLLNDYKEKYNFINNAYAIYNSSCLTSTVLPKKQNKIRKHVISYCGNMGVGRFEIICEIAALIQNNFDNLEFVVAGSIPANEEPENLLKYKVVNYLGKINYDDVIKLYRKSSILLHCENNERIQNLRTAFSTKIADCLSSGVPFLVYGSKKFPFIQYLYENNAAYIAENGRDFVNLVHKILYSFDSEIILENAKRLYFKNHCYKTNSQKFLEIIEGLIV